MKKLLMVLMALQVLASTSLYARRDARITSLHKFDRAASRYPFAAVVFYQDDRDVREYDRMQRVNNSVLNAVHRLSHDWNYKAGNVQFMRVNIVKDDLEDLARDYNITELPTVILLKNGEPVTTDKQSKRDEGKTKVMPVKPVEQSSNAKPEIAKLTGLINLIDLQDFIDTYLGDDIQDLVDQKIEMRRERAALASYYWYSYPYWYNYPYYGGWRNPYWW